MKILIYGSTYISEVVCRHLLKAGFELVGYVASKNPTFPGNMPIPQVGENTPHDLKLSIQYDQKLASLDNAYNLHTGLLPEYGGTNLLYHTLKNGAEEQGLTFHKMTEFYDFGKIVAKISYPVFKDDKVADLYERMVRIAPLFTEICLRNITWGGNAYRPTLYKRSDIEPNISERDVAAIRERIKKI